MHCIAIPMSISEHQRLHLDEINELINKKINVLDTMLTPSAGLHWCEMLLCKVSFATKHENRTNYRRIDTNFEVISHTAGE